MRLFHISTVFSLLLALSFTMAPLSPAKAEIVSRTVEYKLAGQTYEGYLAYDDSLKDKRPGILVAHNWMGVSDETKSKANEVAKLGYVAFAVDIYGKNSRPKNAEEAGQLASMYKKDRTLLRARMQQGLKVLRDQKFVDKSKIAAVGYCFGGMAAIELARAGADIKGVVSFHGSLDSPKPEDGARIKAKVLALHGADDPYVSAKDLEAFEGEMKKHDIDWQLIKFGNAVHSFTDKDAGSDNSKGAAYNEKADRRSWVDMTQFFKEIF